MRTLDADKDTVEDDRMMNALRKRMQAMKEDESPKDPSEDKDNNTPGMDGEF